MRYVDIIGMEHDMTLGLVSLDGSVYIVCSVRSVLPVRPEYGMEVGTEFTDGFCPCCTSFAIGCLLGFALPFGGVCGNAATFAACASLTSFGVGVEA
jgi:hypothetical protein